MADTTTPRVAQGIRAIDLLRKAANFEPIRQEVTLANGDEFVFYVSPLTAAEREKAQSTAKGNSDFGFQLLVAKALDANGDKLFKPGDIDVMRQEVEDEDVQKIILCVLKPRDKKDAEPDSKSN
jgi:hypothetical protein